jgi:hypothetical protein
MSKQSIRRHANEYRLKVVESIKVDLLEYVNALITVAEEKRFEERYGEEHMRGLIEQGIFYRLKSMSEVELGKIAALEEARKLLGLE